MAQSYSQNIKKYARGSGSLPPYAVKKFARGNAKCLLGVPDKRPVLSVGCGLGYEVQACMELGIPCVGVDLDRRQLSYAETRMRKHGLNPKLCQYDARDLKFEDESFSSVFSYGMLMMVPLVSKLADRKVLTHDETETEVKKILSEMKRVVRSQGGIRIVTFSDRMKSEPGYYKPKPEQLERLGVEVGLEAVEVNYHKKDPRMIDANFKKS